MRFLQLVLAVFFLLGLPACRQLSAALSTQGYHDYQKGDYDRAIRAYDNAIRWNPKSPGAFNGRGAAYVAKGNYDQAIQDFNEAIHLNPQAAGAFNGRGSAYFTKGDYDRALQDLNEAIRLNPKSPRALLNLGIANIYAGHFSEAQQDLSQYLDPKDPYSVVWLYLARAKGGTDGKDELKTNAAALNLSTWPGPVIQLYLGQNTPEDVLHAAGSDSGQRCEYSFYVGEYRALRGERPEALALFRTASDGCPKDFIEYVPALTEVRDLEKQK
jgi:lipoprotein NlpI